MNLNHFYHYYKSKSGGVSNLLKATEDFTSSLDWLKKPDTAPPTITGGVTDPNGGTDAQRVNFTANRQSRVQQSVTLSASTQYTFSVYARVNTGTDQFRLRNITLGEAEPKTATTSWTRFEYTFTTTTGGVYELSIQNTENVAANIEFFGAMLNVGSSANAYVKVDPSTGGSAPTPAYSGFGDVFGGATAYYSLRQFTEAETLNAIRVRRSSDDTEQDIGFDSNGDLDTTALLAFVNEDYDHYTSNWAAGVDGWTVNNAGGGTVTLSNDTNRLKVDVSGMTTTGLRPALNFPTTIWSNITEGCSVTITIEGSNLVVDGFLVDGTVQNNFSNHDLDTGTFTHTFTKAASNTAIIYFNSTGKGDYVGFLESVVVTQTTADGAVTTFYDQTGNRNDATNATASEQPLVVSGGTLVEENSKAAIDFDGVDDSFDVSKITLSDDWNLFMTHKLDANSYYFGDTIGADYLRYRINDSYRLSIAGVSATVTGIGDITGAQKLLNIERDSSNNLEYYLNGTSAATTSISGAWDIDEIGASATNHFDGTIQELIVFNSDQSANRGTVTTGGGTGIEGNINTYFDIV